MQSGSQPPPFPSRIWIPWALAVSIWANGMSVIASTWPASRAFTWAAESAKSVTVTWSNHGPSEAGRQ